MLDAVFVRSPHAHARIRRIDVEGARKPPGVVDVVTFAELGAVGRPLPAGPAHAALRERNWLVLARDEVRFVGEAVVAVIARGRACAEDAAGALDVEYEPLPRCRTWTSPAGAAVHEGLDDNLAGRVTLASGDVERALRESPRTLSERYRIARGGGVPIEPRGVVADYVPATGELRVWLSSQVPHDVRRIVAEMLDLPLHRVRVVAPGRRRRVREQADRLPGGRARPVPREANRPARPVDRGTIGAHAGRHPGARAGARRHSGIRRRRPAHRASRPLRPRQRRVHARGLVVPLATASMLSGPYRIPNLEITVSSMFTNRVPVTPYRGSGQPQAVFVIERVLDAVARETGRDRIAVRLANLVQPGEMPYDTGLPKVPGRRHRRVRHRGLPRGPSGNAPRLPVRRASWRSARAPRSRAGSPAWGIACYVEGTALGPFEGATVRVEPSGRVVLSSGVASPGPGIETTLARSARASSA
jgi:carbon-monoxide dehydrogenase large subunit